MGSETNKQNVNNVKENNNKNIRLYIVFQFHVNNCIGRDNEKCTALTPTINFYNNYSNILSLNINTPATCRVLSMGTLVLPAGPV